MRRLGLFTLFFLTACGDDASTNAPPTGGQGGAEPQGGAGNSGGVGNAGGTGGAGNNGGGGSAICDPTPSAIPSGTTELSWDDGTPFSSVRAQDWEITSDATYVLNDELLHEAARFELAHPAIVYGFSIHWSDLPESVAPNELPLTAGLYRDFGNNGFDFWAEEPLVEMTPCASVIDSDGWLHYTFDQPITIDHPGLIYVAHLADPTSPVFSFDETVTNDGDCNAWDNCHSAFNMPEAAAAQNYNGLSFPIPYDFLVRLHVEYTDNVGPLDTFFQPIAFDGTKNHVSFGDFDLDGDDDMITSGPTLYENVGGTFADATGSSGIAAMGLSATGGVWGDLDNDGCLDLVLYAESYTNADAILMSNCDGTFTDTTAASGVTDVQSYNDCGNPANIRSPSAAAALIDLDADGLLDIYFANFICWDQGSFYTDTVWHNLGGGTFEEWTGQNGFALSQTPSRGAAPIDANRDGDVDLFINNYRLEPNVYYSNSNNAGVSLAADFFGIAGHETLNYYGHTIGAAWGDLDNDGDFDLIAANLAHPRFFHFSDKTQILIQDATGQFDDLADAWTLPDSATSGLRYSETHSVPTLADFDQDGALDLVVTAVYDGRPTDFYWGNGDGTFTLDAYHAGITTENGWGAAASDFDLDGDMDLFAHTPFENTLTGVGHFLQVRAIGNDGSNWSALGATVEVVTANQTLIRHVQGGTGKGGQDSQYLHFGLGADTVVTSISVTFPGGKTVTFDGPFSADERVWVMEDGTSFVGWTPPPSL